jgi:hypothetical protein
LEYKNKKLSEYDDTATDDAKMLGQQRIDIKNIYNFQYYGPIYMGSSAKEMFVSYDTGSDVRINRSFNLLVAGSRIK